MPQFEKYFTLDEALEMLPFVRASFERISSIREELGLTAEAMEQLTKKAGSNGGGQRSTGYLEKILSLNAVLSELSDRGILVKDVNVGLVDFPHIRDGREVLLCFMMGEETIAYYHEVETGFAGRRPL